MILESERLILRRWEERDLEPFAAINADPEVLRYIGNGAPQTREESDAAVARIEQRFDDNGFGLWCVVTREEPERCLGFTGLNLPTFLPEVLPAVEIGWRLARSAWGKGYATEAALAAQAYAFDVIELDRLVSIRHPDNDRSRRVMEKLGLVHERDSVVPAEGLPCSIHAMTREDFNRVRRPPSRPDG